jgi:hypothetical protein
MKPCFNLILEEEKSGWRLLNICIYWESVSLANHEINLKAKTYGLRNFLWVDIIGIGFK